jgi:hypothetical protein
VHDDRRFRPPELVLLGVPQFEGLFLVEILVVHPEIRDLAVQTLADPGDHVEVFFGAVVLK